MLTTYSSLNNSISTQFLQLKVDEGEVSILRCSIILNSGVPSEFFGLLDSNSFDSGIWFPVNNTDAFPGEFDEAGNPPLRKVPQ
jgi:hypothetical protein